MCPINENRVMLGTIPKMVAFMKSRQHTPEAAAAEFIAVKGIIVIIWSMRTRT
jgi:hypothetical protein